MHKILFGSLFFVVALTSTALPAARTPLHEAAAGGSIKQLQSLLTQNPAGVNAKDNNSWTPLHHATYWRRFKCVQELLNAGADVYATNNEGKTAKDIAREEDYENIVALLQSYEGLPDIKEPEVN
ncbi:ankyrin repeat domain-containing protein [bacterium]|nr:MAG: ankyrin repeat domain-containing protein [bacterium]